MSNSLSRERERKRKRVVQASCPQVNRLLIGAAHCPQVLLRILGLIAQQSITPSAVHFTHTRRGIWIEIGLESLGEQSMLVLQQKIAALVMVKSVRPLKPK